MTTGRPSTYSLEIVSEICQRIASGETLTQVCEDEHLPAVPTVMDWLHGYQNGQPKKEFIEAYTRARESQVHAWVDKSMEIAFGAQPNEANLARVQIDAIHWIASKIIPKLYGDIRQLDVSGGIDLNVTPVRKVIGSGETRIEHQAAHQIAQDTGGDDSESG